MRHYVHWLSSKPSPRTLLLIILLWISTLPGGDQSVRTPSTAVEKVAIGSVGLPNLEPGGQAVADVWLTVEAYRQINRYEDSSYVPFRYPSRYISRTYTALNVSELAKKWMISGNERYWENDNTVVIEMNLCPLPITVRTKRYSSEPRSANTKFRNIYIKFGTALPAEYSVLKVKQLHLIGRSSNHHACSKHRRKDLSEIVSEKQNSSR